jgi:hypothetical protein
MKLEDQVVSIELAKRLKELGIKQCGYFTIIHEPYYDISYNIFESCKCVIDPERCASAFTVAELLEMMPFPLSCIEFGNGYQWVANKSTGNKLSSLSSLSKSAADCLAKVIIYLIENDLVSKEWKEKWLNKENK